MITSLYKFCCPQFISGKSTPNVSRYPLFDFLFTRTEVFTSNPLACSNISTRKQRLRLMFTNSLESYLQNQTSRRNSYCHLFTDIDMYSSLLRVKVLSTPQSNTNVVMSCGGVSIFISHLFLVKLFTKTCFVLKHQLVVDIHLCLHHWSVCQSIKSCKYKKRLSCTWIFKGTKGHCASEMSYSRHQHTDRVGLKFTPLTPKSNTLIMRHQNFSQ